MVCSKKTDKCINCNEHFENLFEGVKEIIVTKRFLKDAPDFNIELITDCKNEYFTHLHKFEKKIGDSYIFRALKDDEHFLYAIKDNKMIFLRAFKNFKEYEKFLEDNKAIKTLIG
jgi:Txe/YoeB family toxin of Txe-Axe toxin-antitoxin module